MPYDEFQHREFQNLTAHISTGRGLRDLGAFQSSELFILSAIALWCDHYRGVACRRAMVRNGFYAVGLAETDYAAFSCALETVVASAKRPLVLPEKDLTAPTQDQTWLLECFALAQHQKSPEAASLLAVLLPPAAVAITLEALKDLGRSLTGTGLYLRMRSVINRPGLSIAGFGKAVKQKMSLAN